MAKMIHRVDGTIKFKKRLKGIDRDSLDENETVFNRIRDLCLQKGVTQELLIETQTRLLRRNNRIYVEVDRYGNIIPTYKSLRLTCTKRLIDRQDRGIARYRLTYPYGTE